MTYGFVVDVPAPIELYDTLHAEVTRRAGAAKQGLLLHVGRATPGGFQVMEVWESREAKERFDAEVMGPAMATLMQGREPPPMPPLQEFEPRGLIVPAAQVSV